MRGGVGLGDLGKTLKTYRTKKYLSVEEVSSITKIKDHYISALEEEDLENLPARVYTVGFLKNLADLYDLSPSELILSYDRIRDGYDRSHRGRQFIGTGKELKYEEEEPEEDDDAQLFHELELPQKDTLERIRSLSMEDSAGEDEISAYIQRSKKELEELALKKELARELNLNDSDLGTDQVESHGEDTYPTAKIMLEFEELMKEEERFNTQKLRRMESERNINKAKNTMRTRRPLDMDQGGKNGAGLMILVLLVAAILVLLYIIITALISQ